MNNPANLEETILRQALELTDAKAQISDLMEVREALRSELRSEIENNEEEFAKLRLKAKTYDAMLEAVKRYFQDGRIPLPAVVAAKKEMPTLTVGAPECGALPNGRILPFRVTYTAGSSSYDVSFVLAPVLESERDIREFFPHYQPVQWVAKKLSVRKSRKKAEAK